MDIIETDEALSEQIKEDELQLISMNIHSNSVITETEQGRLLGRGRLRNRDAY